MDKAKCGACDKSLGRYPTVACTSCCTKFHKTCLALPAKANVGDDWVCPSCKKTERRGDNSLTPVRGLVVCPEPARVVPTDGGSLDEMGGSTTTTDETDLGVNSLAEFRREFADCIIELRGCRQEMAMLRATIVDLSTRLTTVEKRLDELEKGGVGAGNVELEQTVVELEKTVEQLKAELNDRDQDALLTDLDISNVPEVPGENVTHTVTVLASKLGVILAPSDIVFAERVGRSTVSREPGVNEPKRGRRLVVRLARRQLRDELLRSARVRRTLSSADLGSLGSAGTPQRVYVNERLTGHNRQLFYRVREECRRLNWRYVWTKRGRIFARLADGKPVHHIRSTADIERVFKVNTV